MAGGSWQKRMGRNSLFGVGAYYGVYTNKLLFCSTRVSRCTVCMKATAAGTEIPDHECTRTWNERKDKDDGPSNMENIMALEGSEALFEHGVITRCIVCDGDTKTVSHIKAQAPKEIADVVRSVLDLNHVAKNVGGKLRSLPWMSEKVAAHL